MFFILIQCIVGMSEADSSGQDNLILSEQSPVVVEDDYVEENYSQEATNPNDSPALPNDEQEMDPQILQSSVPVAQPQQPAFRIKNLATKLFNFARPVLKKAESKLQEKLDHLLAKMRDRSPQHKEKLRKCWRLFDKFKKVYKKKFKSEYKEARGLENFESNNDLCEEKNKEKNRPYELGVNEWSYLSFDEFSERFLMKETEQFNDEKYLLQKLKENPSRLAFFQSKRATVGSSPWGSRRLLQAFDIARYAANLSIPTAKSWKQYVSPVKNQGRCNSCYAFAGIGALEALLKYKLGETIILSEQEIVDCSSWDYGCRGGDPANSILYYAYYGLAYQSFYPYVGVKGTCKYLSYDQKHQTQVYSTYLGGDVDSLLIALSQGPVAVIHEVDREFSLYKTGVYTKEKCGISLNHSAVAFGYNLNAPIPYIEVKNGWGPNWGEGGFYKLALGPLDGTYSRGTCGLFSHSYNSQPYTSY